jgi:hypothetical protein
MSIQRMTSQGESLEGNKHIMESIIHTGTKNKTAINDKTIQHNQKNINDDFSRKNNNKKTIHKHKKLNLSYKITIIKICTSMQNGHHEKIEHHQVGITKQQT